MPKFLSVYYIGYEWNPKSVTVIVGDTVRFEWTTPEGVSGSAYQVVEVDSPDTTTPKANGFSSGPATANGVLTVKICPA